MTDMKHERYSTGDVAVTIYTGPDPNAVCQNCGARFHEAINGVCPAKVLALLETRTAALPLATVEINPSPPANIPLPPDVQFSTAEGDETPPPRGEPRPYVEPPLMGKDETETTS